MCLGPDRQSVTQPSYHVDIRSHITVSHLLWQWMNLIILINILFRGGCCFYAPNYITEHHAKQIATADSVQWRANQTC